MQWQAMFERGAVMSAEQGLTSWYAALLEQAGAQATPLTLAQLGGLRAATPGLAFLAGYQAALRALWPQAPQALGALCVSERRSTRPADLTTRLEGAVLHGCKDFVTAGAEASWLLVAAREEPEGNTPQVGLVVVDATVSGVSLQSLPALPMMPDIGHARVQLTGTCAERLPGDGWDAYVKPFRTLEDTYVLTAVTAWLLASAREAGLEQALQLRLLAQLAGCAQVAASPADDQGSHLLLAGLFAQHQALAAELEPALERAGGTRAALWKRDRQLLKVAESARAQRLNKAWLALHEA